MFRFIFILILVFLVFSSLWGFYISIRPPKIVSSITPQDFELAYEEVKFSTEDGVDLTGWFIPNENSEKAIILLHGYPADKGNILPFTYFLNEEYNLFLFDFRYFGESEGSYSTAGIKETKDLKSAVEFLKERGIHEIGVWGFSMGGAVALMGSSEIPEIKAVISEASYANLDLMSRELYLIPFLDYPLSKLTGLWGRLFLGIDINKTSPLKLAKNLEIPVLIIHSENDDVIPFRHALLLKDSLKDNPMADFWFQEDLVHGQLGGEYQERLRLFFANSL